MRLGRVVGNVVSVVKDPSHHNYKLMIIEFVDEKGNATSARQIAIDGANAGVGDFVLINVDGGAAKQLLDDKEVIIDLTICGVIDHISYDKRNITL